MVLNVKDMQQKNDRSLLPTPPMPNRARVVELTENAAKVFIRRYARRDQDGNPIETVHETFWRVAYHVAAAEEQSEQDILEVAHGFYDLLATKRFLPNSPTFTGAGTPLGQLAACFVLPLSDDMGRAHDGIFQTLRNAALIQQTGGGNGFSFSRLRPMGTVINSSAGEATGPVGFLHVYDSAFGEIAQGGTRRGANMAVLRVDHPDIEEFITSKVDENAITNFNISVGITDAFMEAVQADTSWQLRFPDVNHPAYRGFDGSFEQAEAAGIPIQVYAELRARDLFDKIVFQSHHNGEPGILFPDAANRENPVPHLYELEATNPCGEQWLGPYENCCLGSINLAQHTNPDSAVDWTALQKTIKGAARFLDNVVDANAYVPAVPALAESAHRARRIGLGIMGLGDLMYHTGVRYGSKDGQEFASQVMEFVRYHVMLASIELAEARGSFPAITGSIYDPDNLTWQPPQSIVPYHRDYGRPSLDWNIITNGIKQNGIRNAAQTTIAPTGTIATVAGCEGYGCEPVFALAYTRHVNDNGKDLQLTYTSPLFEHALSEASLDDKTRQSIVDQVVKRGTCQHIDNIPAVIRDVFVVSHDISAEEHVRMQGALQAFVDNSLSKTINFSADAAPKDIANAYQLAWKLGCKGITVYVAGSRDQVVLETKATAEKKEVSVESLVDEMHLWQMKKKPRPRLLEGHTFSITTPLGKAFVTINENGERQPFEIFINTAKAGSDTAAVSEAIGRLLSYVLRLASPVEPRERMREIVRQLEGIGGGRSLGFGPNRVRSLPDGVSQALDAYLTNTASRYSKDTAQDEVDHHHQQDEALLDAELVERPSEAFRIGDLCPDCGQAAYVNEEGCRKCYACGFSEC